MHPREGWIEPGVRRPVSRRQFLAGAGGLWLSADWEGCSVRAARSGARQEARRIIGYPAARARTTRSVAVFTDNSAIASNLQPETGATLQLYNWVAYINQQVVDNFEKKYKCKVQLTTFNTMTEALSKLQTGEIPFDVFFPTVDVLGQLVEVEAHHGPSTTPTSRTSRRPGRSSRTRSTTRVGSTRSRTRSTPPASRGVTTTSPGAPHDMANPWAFPWQTRSTRARSRSWTTTARRMSLGLMKNGMFDLNTTSTSQINAAKQSLENLKTLTNVQIDNNDYTDVPTARSGSTTRWSGDMAAAASYMPKGVPVEVVSYWFPSDGKGPVGNDTMVALKSGKNPVLAHLFLNYMLDLDNALENISFNGYMQPLTGVTPQMLVAEQILPPNLTSTVVLPSYFDRGVSELELAPAVDAEWQQNWNEFSGGL